MPRPAPPAPPSTTPFEAMPAFCVATGESKLPLRVRQKILLFLYSFDGGAFMDRLLYVMTFVEIRPHHPKIVLPLVPNILAVKRAAKLARAQKRDLRRVKSHKSL